jgi:hypothetical protein
MKIYPVKAPVWLADVKSSDSSPDQVPPETIVPSAASPTPGVVPVAVVNENVVPAPVVVRG